MQYFSQFLDLPAAWGLKTLAVASREGVGESSGRMDCCGTRGGAICVSKLGECMAKTQNKPALPKYKENKRNNLPDWWRGRALRGEVGGEGIRWAVRELQQGEGCCGGKSHCHERWVGQLMESGRRSGRRIVYFQKQLWLHSYYLDAEKIHLDHLPRSEHRPR